MNNQLKALAAIQAECQRQQEKWGQQNWPSLLEVEPDKICHEYKIAKEATYKQVVETAYANGTLTWADILMEEIAEAISTTNPEDLKTELTQCAAVIVSWIESIDRNGR